MKRVFSFTNHRIWGLCLVVAPLLMVVSTIFWVNGEYGVTGGTLLVLSTVFWIPALMNLFAMSSRAYPNTSVIGFMLAVYGFSSGANFGTLGYLSAIFNLDHSQYIRSLESYPFSSGILLFWGGPLGPLSLILLGTLLIKSRSVSRLTGILLIAGALAFPLSRISRIQWVAHLSDILLALPLVYLGIKRISRKDLPIANS